jgi:oxygen-independent coproporphyrinogen-3 oxidase
MTSSPAECLPETPAFDLDLIRQHNVAAPRYTSYPPATELRDAFPLDRVVDNIQRCNNGNVRRNLSLYVHLPFCENLCWYCGCTTIITRDRDHSRRYIELLSREIDLLEPLISPERRVVQLHLGGGTPTFCSPDELRQIATLLRSKFAFASNIEASVEIDPRHLSAAHVEALSIAGFNRASIGVQDFDPVVQKAVHREQSIECTTLAIERLRSAGFKSINIDLIYGLPGQTPEGYGRTLVEVLRLRPDRIATYSYAHVPWHKPSQKVFRDLPNAEAKLRLMALTTAMLAPAGYVYIGMDHFALATDALALAQKSGGLQRNFQGYSTHADTDIHALGVSGISQTPDVFWQNEKTLPAYTEKIVAGQLPVARGYEMTLDDKRRRHIIMRLMCDMALNIERLSDDLDLDVEESFPDEIARMREFESDGLVEFTADGKGLRVTHTGRFLVRNIASGWDAFARSREANRFSKAI